MLLESVGVLYSCFPEHCSPCDFVPYNRYAVNAKYTSNFARRDSARYHPGSARSAVLILIGPPFSSSSLRRSHPYQSAILILISPPFSSLSVRRSHPHQSTVLIFINPPFSSSSLHRSHPHHSTVLILITPPFSALSVRRSHHSTVLSFISPPFSHSSSSSRLLSMSSFSFSSSM